MDIIGSGNMEKEPKETSPEVIPGTWSDLLLYIFAGFGLYVVASILVSLPFQEIDLTVTTLAILTNVLFIGGGAYVLGIRRKKITWASLGISPPVWKPEYLLWAFLLAVGLMPIRGVIGLVVEILLEGDFDNLQLRSDLFTAGMDNGYAYLILLLGVGILAPISEELFFRGLIYNWFRQRWGMWVSILLSSIWFSIGHIDSLGVVASSFLMGGVIAYVYERTRSLWFAIAIHLITNSISVLLLMLIQLISPYIPV
ncbi:MAG: type II CAAX endopeptidase family protein [Anaerolineales bacterium]